MTNVYAWIALKLLILVPIAFWLGQALIGANIGAWAWKEAEKEEPTLPLRVRVMTSTFRVLTGIISVIVAAGYVWFAVWWLDMLGQGATP